MDTLTHTVLGACTGELIAGRKLGKKAMLIGALVNNLPDIDMVSNFWASDAHALLTHRGITHSILFAVLTTPLLAWLLAKYYNRYDLPFSRWLFLTGHGLFLHILTDSCTTYGTGLFEPFSNYRVSFNTLFILDPVFMLFPLICFIILLITKTNREKLRRRSASAALIISCLYLLVTISIKLTINKKAEGELAKNNLATERYMTSPTPLNNVLWYLIGETSDHYAVGYYSLFDENKNVRFFRIPKSHHLLPETSSADLNDLKHFSKGFYSVSARPGYKLFSDLRFGQIGTARLDSAPFVFNFDVYTNGSELRITQSEFQTTKEGEVTALFKRMAGNQ